MKQQRAYTASTIGTARDVAELLSVDLDTVYRAAREGALPALRVGRQWRFDLAVIAARMGSTESGRS